VLAVVLVGLVVVSTIASIDGTRAYRGLLLTYGTPQ
jgi:hypothetical protein